MTGRKDDGFDGTKPRKLRRSLFPRYVMDVVLRVMEYGATRYGDDNWQDVPNARVRYYDAAERHINQWLHGEREDSESGLHHLGHAICCLSYIMWFDITGKE